MTAYRVRNWSSYNRSLVNRGDITLWLSEEIIKNWTADGGRGVHGNQRFSDAVIRSSYVLKQIFHLSLRATSGFLRSILKLMNFTLRVPDYTTICRRGKSLEIALAGLIPSNARHVLIDATGVRVFGEGEWKVRLLILLAFS